MAKSKNDQVTLPKGEFRFPNLQEADRYDETANWQYKTDVIFNDPNEVQDVIERIDALHEEITEKTKKANPKKKNKIEKADPPYEYELDDEGNETGRVILKTRQNLYIRDPKSGKNKEISVPLFDAKGKKIDKFLNLGNGTVGRVRVELAPMAVGQKCYVKLRLKAAQIIEIVQFGAGDDPEAFGFGAEDEGFDADEVEEAERPSSGGDGDGEDASGDDPEDGDDPDADEDDGEDEGNSAEINF